VPYRVLGRQRQEFYGMEVDRDGFALLVAQFESTDGQISDQFTFRRAEVAVDGDTAHVHLIVSQSEGAQPGSLDEVLAGAQALLADESVQHYRVHVLEDEGLQIQFVARDVPPLGYLTYTLGAVSGKQEAGSNRAEEQRGRGAEEQGGKGPIVNCVENEYFHVAVNPDDGTLTITDKATGRVLQGCNRFVDGGDRGDEYNYCQPEHDRTVDRPATAPTVRLLSADEVGTTLEIALAYRVPVALASGDCAFRSDEAIPLPIVTRVTLTPGVRRVDFETTVGNHQARDHRLRVHFPTGLRVEAAWADGHVDVVERPLDLPTEIEGWAEHPASTHPQRAFVDVSDGAQGIMLANRGLPEYEVLRTKDGAEIVLTLLRCVGWLSRDDLHCREGRCGPGDATPEAQCPGQHTFRYSLIPHTGDYRQAHALAYGFQTDLRAVYTDARPDSPVLSRAAGPVLSEAEGLPTALSFVTVEPSTLEVSAVKEPEKGAGLIVRCWNVGGEPVEGTLRLWQPFRRALRVNLAEEEVAELGRGANEVTLPVRGRQVVTSRFEF
jgi:mannosylglycerate hydrolase